MTDYTLEELAQRYEDERIVLEALDAEVERLKAPYHAAVDRLRCAERRIEMLKLAIESGKHSYMVNRALADVGVETDARAMIVVTPDYGNPTPYFLAAVAADGVGLYRHKPDKSHRYQGTSYAIERRHLPETLAAMNDASGRISLFTAAGYSRSAGEESLPINDELVGWQGRSKGDFGDGSGSIKPLPPPNGGRWRWLKVREQEKLTT